MRLKSLEIKGFKSFADKTIVNFDENITGIVGPNGCGKSNIVDSIRWVIGEQKISSLRSENLESLVFNGSKTRAASGLAEVSLTFENTKNLLPTEFSTVRITRKFYKSGDSEYRLNDVQCRLKDIQNLFMDTGISTDSYAIIALDMVDDLIRDKDNSRRKMLEQAAGISIYKTRKKEAKQKLDATEQDLSRIEDLLFEINNQLKSLENQAKKAEKYHEIKKDYREISIELAKAALEGFNLTYKNLTSSQETETDKIIRLEAEIATEEAQIEQEKLAFIEKERALQSMQYAYNELVQQVRTKEGDKNLAAQRIQYLGEKEISLQSFLDKSDTQLKGIEESIIFTDKQVHEEHLALEGLMELMQNMRDERDAKRAIVDEKRAKVDELRIDFQQLQRAQFDAEKKVAIADTSVQNIERTIHQLEHEVEQRQDQFLSIETDRTVKEKELEEKNISLEQLQAHHDQTKEQIFQSQAVLEELRNELAGENRTLDAKKNEHDLLKSMIDSMEGYPESVKFLHNNKDWNFKAPILSDIIYVKEAYRAAIENILEPYLNYYVVNNLQEGVQAIQLLDTNKKGKANFFLLDIINKKNHTVAATLSHAINALDVVEVDEQYKHLAQHLLANVFIAEDESALENKNGVIIIEKTGKFVKGEYTITGGSVGLIEGKKIGRAKNLEKLMEQISDQEIIVQTLKSKILAKHNDVIAFNEDLRESAIKETQKLIQELTNTVISLQNKSENIQGQQSVAKNKLEDYTEQLQNTHSAIQGVREELNQLNEELQMQSNALSAAQEEFKVVEVDLNTVVQQFNEYNITVTRQQSKITSIQQELQFKKNQLGELNTQIANSTIQLAETIENVTTAKKELADIEAVLLSLIKQREADQAALNEADQLYYNLRNHLNEKESALRLRSKEKEQVEHVLTAVKDKLNELKLQLAGTRERLNVEFRIQIEDILDDPRNSETPVEELQERVDRMKKRLENLGEVNPTAIEAYTEMKKRYEFIVEQKTDLVNAKESLMKTIEEVESTANQKFLETFNKVRENFQVVFKSLFTEDDQCDLVLENPENLAETGIDVIAKPKGKRPSSLTQLSGGERTLTATALLFAIYLIKPAPFCILYEVDAPLDDANVSKFTNMIRKFSDNSQFIIVTHNKTTMSTVDVIYGVTMQEPGVSKLVSVDFRNLQAS